MTFLWLVHAAQQLNKGRFSTSIFPDNCKMFPTFDYKTDILYGRLCAARIRKAYMFKTNLMRRWTSNRYFFRSLFGLLSSLNKIKKLLTMWCLHRYVLHGVDKHTCTLWDTWQCTRVQKHISNRKISLCCTDANDQIASKTNQSPKHLANRTVWRFFSASGFPYTLTHFLVKRIAKTANAVLLLIQAHILCCFVCRNVFIHII